MDSTQIPPQSPALLHAHALQMVQFPSRPGRQCGSQSCGQVPPRTIAAACLLTAAAAAAVSVVIAVTSIAPLLSLSACLLPTTLVTSRLKLI